MAEDSPKELFEFFQKMWNPMSFPSPACSSHHELSRRWKKDRGTAIGRELAEMNLTFVQMTVKTLEMQKSALQSIQESAAARAEKPPKKPKDDGRGTKN